MTEVPSLAGMTFQQWHVLAEQLKNGETESKARPSGETQPIYRSRSTCPEGGWTTAGGVSAPWKAMNAFLSSRTAGGWRG